MNAPHTPHEQVERVLHAYDCQCALGAGAAAAVDVAAALLRVSRETVIKAVAVRDAVPRTLRLAA